LSFFLYDCLLQSVITVGYDTNLNGHGISLDSKGFIKTGLNLLPEGLSAARWPLARQQYLLEASLPGSFAVGDVRGGSTKRVASAVGEGSIAISFIHKALQK
jgi:thioredoxin reductase (NADPH)